MTAAWMLYAVVLTALLCAGALAVERIVEIWRGPRRVVWAAVMLAAVLVPILLATRAVPDQERISRSEYMAREKAGTLTGTVSRDPSGIASRMLASVVDAEALARIDRALLAADPYVRTAWVSASALLLALYLAAFARFQVRARRWPRVELCGDEVLLAPDIGPAVVGIVAPRVVIPEWALALGGRARTLMLRHEDEHVRAGDPQLLFASALVLIAFPWNAALWFAIGRLRLAIELDCDGRVLLQSEESGEYGQLLLDVCARGRAWIPLAASLAEHTPHIERRILAMSADRPRRPVALSTAFGTLALATLAIACVEPRPASLRATSMYTPTGVLMLPSVAVGGYQPSARAREVVLDSGGSDSAKKASLERFPIRSVDQLQALLAEHNPEVLAADAAARFNVTFVFDATGAYVFSAAVRVVPGDEMRSWYFFEHRMTPGDSEPRVYLKDMTPLGTFDSFVDVDVRGGKLAPRVAHLKLITLKRRA